MNGILTAMCWICKHCFNLIDNIFKQSNEFTNIDSMYILIFLFASTANNEQTDLKEEKIWIEFINLYNFLALSTNFGHIPKYIDDRTVATHLVMAITNVQTAWNWNIVNNICRSNRWNNKNEHITNIYCNCAARYLVFW